MHLSGEEEGEIYMAFETQKTMLNQLENELKSVKMSARDCEQNLNAEIRQLREYNQKLQQIILSEMTPAEKATCFLQGEIARLSRENVDLKEKYDRTIEQIRRLKRQNKISSNQHNHNHADVSDSVSIDDELDADGGNNNRLNEQEHCFLFITEHNILPYST